MHGKIGCQRRTDTVFVCLGLTSSGCCRPEQLLLHGGSLSLHMHLATSQTTESQIPTTLASLTYEDAINSGTWYLSLPLDWYYHGPAC